MRPIAPSPVTRVEDLQACATVEAALAAAEAAPTSWG